MYFSYFCGGELIQTYLNSNFFELIHLGQEYEKKKKDPMCWLVGRVFENSLSVNMKDYNASITCVWKIVLIVMNFFWLKP